MIWSTLKLPFLVLIVSLCFCEFDRFSYECDEKNEIQLLLFLMWDIWTLSCSKNQLNSFALASSTCSQICLSHRVHNVFLTGKVMMMIEGTGLPCRVVRLAGGVRSPPGVGANEPSWATLCARCGSEQGGGASVHVVVVRHWQSVHTVARMCTLCRECSLPVLASVPALESAGARGWWAPHYFSRHHQDPPLQKSPLHCKKSSPAKRNKRKHYS